MLLSTKSDDEAKKIFISIYKPKSNSHKGDNGKILVIGGSKLFHSASIWAAEVSSHIVDMVHYSSTHENNEIIKSVKKKFINGIVITREDLEKYIEEDDAILIGPGMVRGEKLEIDKDLKFDELLEITDESKFTRYLIYYLIINYPNKKFVFDAGALQMMDKEWLLKIKTKPILTPHSLEFERLFGINIKSQDTNKRVELVQEYAAKFNCIILFKGVKDIVSDGRRTYVIEGGNAGLAKGGSGDVLAGLVTSFYAKSKAFESAVLSSFVIKKTADELFLKKGYWYNVSNIIEAIPNTLKSLL